MFLLFDIGEFFQKALIAINVGIYKLVGYIYQIFLTLAETNLFSEAEYHRLVDKIYIVLGVVVLFIIAYNILTYIVDPDKDKNFTASGKLIKNIVVTFIMIAVCPFLFSFAYGIQGAILNGDLIFGFFDTGSGATETSSGMNIRNGGIRMAADTFFTFFDPLGDKTQVNQSNGKTYNHSTTYKCLSDYSAKDECFKRWGLPNEACTYNGSSITCNYSIKCSKGDCNFQEMRNYVQNTGSFAPVNAFAKNVSEGQIEYDWLLALICGAFLGYMIISFCFDLAVRIAKLTFYQIIAPLTIACRILPSQDKIYKNWFSAVKNTYFMVFIRVFVMALGIYLINQFETNFLNVFFSEGTVNNGSSLGIRQFAFVFVILGILTFLQQAPKLVEEIFGIKDVKLGIRDKFYKDSGLNKLASAGVGALGAAAQNATAHWKDKKGKKSRVPAAILSGIGGAVGGARRGLKQGKDALTMKDIYKSGAAAADEAHLVAEQRMKAVNDNGGIFQAIGQDAKEHWSNFMDFLTGATTARLQAEQSQTKRLKTANSGLEDGLGAVIEKESGKDKTLELKGIDENGNIVIETVDFSELNRHRIARENAKTKGDYELAEAEDRAYNAEMDRLRAELCKYAGRKDYEKYWDASTKKKLEPAKSAIEEYKTAFLGATTTEAVKEAYGENLPNIVKAYRDNTEDFQYRKLGDPEKEREFAESVEKLDSTIKTLDASLENETEIIKRKETVETQSQKLTDEYEKQTQLLTDMVTKFAEESIKVGSQFKFDSDKFGFDKFFDDVTGKLDVNAALQGILSMPSDSDFIKTANIEVKSAITDILREREKQSETLVQLKKTNESIVSLAQDAKNAEERLKLLEEQKKKVQEEKKVLKDEHALYLKKAFDKIDEFDSLEKKVVDNLGRIGAELNRRSKEETSKGDKK